MERGITIIQALWRDPEKKEIVEKMELWPMDDYLRAGGSHVYDRALINSFLKTGLVVNSFSKSKESS